MTLNSWFAPTSWALGLLACANTLIQYWRSNPGLCACKESIPLTEPLHCSQPSSTVFMSVFTWFPDSIVFSIMEPRHGKKSYSVCLRSTRKQDIRGRGCVQDIPLKSWPPVTHFFQWGYTSKYYSRRPRAKTKSPQTRHRTSFHLSLQHAGDRGRQMWVPG